MKFRRSIFHSQFPILSGILLAVLLSTNFNFASAQFRGGTEVCKQAEVKFSVDKTKVYLNEPINFKSEFRWTDPACAKDNPEVHAWFAYYQSAALDVGEYSDDKPVGANQIVTFGVLKSFEDWKEVPYQRADLAAGRIENFNVQVYVLMEYKNGTNVLESDRIDVVVEKGQYVKGKTEHPLSPQTVTNTNNASGRGQTYPPQKIVFSVSTDGRIYRAVEGKTIPIEVKIDLADDSVKPVRFDGTDELARGGFVDNDIEGLYAAAGASGASGFCSGTPRSPVATCNFLEKVSLLGHAVPFQTKLELVTGSKQFVGGKEVDLTAGKKVDLDIFPVIDITGTDEPFSNSGAKITVEVYKTAAEVTAAGGPVSGDPSSSTTSSSSGQGSGSLTGGLVSAVNIIIGTILALLRWILFQIATLIILPILQVTLELDAGAIAGGPILAGWTFVRDIVNMFFILALIVIGFGTMLKLESYNYKKLLTKLILMALLVNFSLLIGRIIIQVLDVAQFTFLSSSSQAAGTGAGQLSGTQGVNYIFQSLVTSHTESIKSALAFSFNAKDALSQTATLFFQFTLELMVIITFAALAIFMVIRTTALWLLLIISPLAYGLAVLPATVEYAKKWWHNFIKYALFAPIMAFFLRLALALYRDGLKIIPPSLGGKEGTGTSGDVFSYLTQLQSQTGGVTGKQLIVLIIVYVMILAFLWAAIFITKQMGIFGAAAITSLAEKGLKAPYALGGKGAAWLGGRGVGYAGRKKAEWSKALYDRYEERAAEKGKRPGWIAKGAFAALSPVATFRAWGARSEELKKQAKAGVEAVGREIVTEAATRGRVKIPYRQMEEEKSQHEILKEYEGMPREQVMFIAKDLAKMGGEEGRRRRRALIAYAASEGYIDDIMSHPEFLKDFKWKDHRGVEHQGFQQPDGTFYSRDQMRDFLSAYVGNDQDALRLMDRIEQYGKKVTHQEYSGLTETDLATGQRKFLSPEDSESEALGETGKFTGRQLMGASPHVFMQLRMAPQFMVDAQGNVHYMNNQGQIATAQDVQNGNIKLIGKGGKMDRYNKGSAKLAFRGQTADAIRQHSQPRESFMEMGGNSTGAVLDNDRFVIIDEMDLQRLQDKVDLGLGQAVQGFYEKTGGTGKFRAKVVQIDPVTRQITGYRIIRAEQADVHPGETALGIRFETNTPENDPRAGAKTVIAS